MREGTQFLVLESFWAFPLALRNCGNNDSSSVLALMQDCVCTALVQCFSALLNYTCLTQTCHNCKAALYPNKKVIRAMVTCGSYIHTMNPIFFASSYVLLIS